MSWEQRLREMVLAGGALAVTACGASTAASSQTESDATSTVGDDADTSAPFETPCCNANSDPCCPMAYCSGGVGPDAASYIACEKSRCPPNETYQMLASGEMVCAAQGSPMDAGPGPVDAGPADAAPSDAPDDISFAFPCCNANADPCCPIAYCAGGVGPDAAVYIDCEQSRSACEATSGNYEAQPDGSIGCTH